ncbi:MAG: hypothetical protein ACC661_07590 [Verrucomicrobiales bacterium]
MTTTTTTTITTTAASKTPGAGNESAASAPRSAPGFALAVRTDPGNPNHHIWKNRETWWCHFTVHLGDFSSQRVRRSLRTRDVEQARAKRDRLFTTLGGLGS